jgi:hypothetical protein
MHMVFPNYVDIFNNPKLPIYERTSNRYPAETIVRILLGSVDPQRVCSIQPLSVQANCTFVVDTSKLESVKNLTADDNGALQPTEKPCTWIRVVFNNGGGVSNVFKLPHKPAVCLVCIATIIVIEQVRISNKLWQLLLISWVEQLA